MPGMTDRGKKNLGHLLAATRKKNGFVNQRDFAVWLTEQSKLKFPNGDHIEVKESQIRTLEAATFQRSFNPDPLYAIVDAEVLKYPDGTPYSYADVAAVLREELVPESSVMCQ